MTGVPWLIDAGGVGALRLGQPLPASLVTAELAARYVAGYLGDGVPYDGFRLDEPPVTVVLSRGPFGELERYGFAGPRSLAEQGGDGVDKRGGHDGEPPLDVLAPRALAAVREGATVAAVMVHGEGVATAAGLGVGSRLPDLERELPGLQLRSVPPTTGGDRCAAHSRQLPGVTFFFHDVDGARGGDQVTRVDVRLPET